MATLSSGLKAFLLFFLMLIVNAMIGTYVWNLPTLSQNSQTLIWGVRISWVLVAITGTFLAPALAITGQRDVNLKNAIFGTMLVFLGYIATATLLMLLLPLLEYSVGGTTIITGMPLMAFQAFFVLLTIVVLFIIPSAVILSEEDVI